MNLFDLIAVGATIIGGIVGFLVGQDQFGIVGAILGALVGIVLGWIIGRLPYVITSKLLLRSLKRSSVEELRSRLERDYFISHLIIAELVTRGEPPASFREAIERQLASASSDVQRFGKVNEQLWLQESKNALL